MHDLKKFDTIERVKKDALRAFIVNVATWPSRSVMIAAMLMTVFFVGGIVSSHVRADNIERSEGERLITLYDRGIEQSFITSAATIGGALAEAGVDIDDSDKIEPALSEQLVASEYSVNVYRARPLVIVDGSLRQKIMTASQSADQIAKDANIKLYPEDIAITKQSDDLLTDGAAEQFVVTRATTFSFTMYGELIESRTQATTVEEMLESKGINLGSNDRLSLPLETPIVEGMELRLWREGKQTLTVEEEIDFETEIISDANRPSSYKEIQTPGEKGKRSVTYEVLIQDGQEVARVEINSVEVTPSKKQVEVRGIKPDTLPYTGGGTRTDWLAASNIPQESWGYADFMVQRESGWNPNAKNQSSGACGLAQALPCSKVGPNWNNPVVSLNWMNGYVNGRYGGWQQAYAFWQKNKWY